MRHLLTIATLAALLATATGCQQTSELYCETSADCTHPERSFCDIDGTTAASDGIGHTCVPDPGGSADAGGSDAGADAGAGTPDAGSDASAGIADASPDAAAGDAGPPDAGGVDANIPDAGPLHDLTVVLAGAGSGAVTSSPAGIDCGSTCLASFPESTLVTLTATPDSGSRFVDWSGACIGTTPTCDVTIAATATATATFADIQIVQVAAGGSHTCALLDTGAVRCWGRNFSGELGYGHTMLIGNTGPPSAAGDVNVGGIVTQITVGGLHTCALLLGGAVRCWGDGADGRLGYGNTDNIGDDELPASAGDVPVGGTVTQVAAGARHTCALLEAGTVRCWGDGADGRLGYANTDSIGDDETPASAGDITVGGVAMQISAGGLHTCALLDTGAVRCWGYGGSGRLGYGNTDTIGDDETPASAGDVDVGGTVTQVAAGTIHTCAVLDTNAIRCWGAGIKGRLGYGNTDNVETPSSAGDVPLGGAATHVAANTHTCARLDTGAVRCWGPGTAGALGYANTNNVGDDETPASAGDILVGGTVTVQGITAASIHTCALLDTDAIRCWGISGLGQLGYGNTITIGDDEVPSSAGDVPLF